MRILPWLKGVVGLDVPPAELDAASAAGAGAYELVDELPRGPARLAAWEGYAQQTYADKLLAASRAAGSLGAETAGLARVSYRLAAACVEQARALAAAPPAAAEGLPGRLPYWPTPLRSQEQLVGMRETLEALRVHVAFDLERVGEDEPALADLRVALAAVDARLEDVDRLWIERPPAELRSGIGDALATGLDRVYELGRRLAFG